MPCKHEGGSDPCVWDSSRNCKVHRRLYRIENRGRIKELRKRLIFANCGATKSDAGEAGELLTAADLLTRGLPTTKPYNRNGSDDLHVNVGGRWRNVQVKLGRVHEITNTISLHKRRGITSDIIAVVDLVGKRIRYISNTDEPLPKELT